MIDVPGDWTDDGLGRYTSTHTGVVLQHCDDGWLASVDSVWVGRGPTPADAVIDLVRTVTSLVASLAPLDAPRLALQRAVRERGVAGAASALGVPRSSVSTALSGRPLSAALARRALDLPSVGDYREALATLAPEQIREATGASPQTVARWISGRHEPGYAARLAILRAAKA